MGRVGGKGVRIALILLVMVVVAGYLFWEFWGGDGGEYEGRREARIAEDCGGEFFDTHSHLDYPELPEVMAEQMGKNGVSCAAIFVQMNPDSYEEDLERYYEDFDGARNVYLPFLDVVRNSETVITNSYLQQVYDELDGKLRGFGEFALYRDELAGTDLTKEPWRKIFAFAGKNSLFVMIHVGIDPGDLVGLRAAMEMYPNTKFLVHGFELGVDGYIELLTEYPNFYYTLDTATMLKEAGEGPTKHLMYPEGRATGDRFLEEYSKYGGKLLKYAKGEYGRIVTAAPDQVMWGTDASMEWHVEPEVYEKLIQFSREFALSLPPGIREKYTYQNAVRLFLGD